MADAGAPPVIPTDLQQYDSYTTDPQWQRTFTLIWGAVLAFFVLRAVGPRLLRAVYGAVFGGRSNEKRGVLKEGKTKSKSRSGRRGGFVGVVGSTGSMLGALVGAVLAAWTGGAGWRGVFGVYEADGAESSVEDTPRSENGEDAEVEYEDAVENGIQPGTLRKSTLMRMEEAMDRVGALWFWTAPGLGLNAGQVTLIAAYIAAVIFCIVTNAPLVSNSNRAGFIALAQFPVVFLLATKNSIVGALLGIGAGTGTGTSTSYSSHGPGYDALNPLHRWAGRLLFLAALLHGALWIRNHVEYGIEIIGAQKETSGVAALGVLCVIVGTSVRGVRTGAWGVFWAVHVLAFPAFFITVCYHTVYAAPWIFPALAFYGLDVLLRLVRYRVLDAVLVPVGKGMTIIHIPHVTHGWRAGQHVRVRVLAPLPYAPSPSSTPSASTNRIRAALAKFAPALRAALDNTPIASAGHPLSVFTAPPAHSCVRVRPGGWGVDGGYGGGYSGNGFDYTSGEKGGEAGVPRGMSLGVRAVGPWSRAVNALAWEGAAFGALRVDDDGVDEEKEKSERGSDNATATANPMPVPVHIALSGPYGGVSLDVGAYESVLLVAGGAGATFALGVLDDIVGRCISRPGAGERGGDGKGVNGSGMRKGRRGGERTRRVEFAWCVRSFGSIDWFAPALMDIAHAAASSRSPASLRTGVAPIDLHISIYVTCLCNPEAVPPIPNCDVTIVRPSVGGLIDAIMARPHGPGGTAMQTSAPPKPPLTPGAGGQTVLEDSDADIQTVDVDTDDLDDLDDASVDLDVEKGARVAGVHMGSRLPPMRPGGGLAVCASGPEGLVREAANAVARLQMRAMFGVGKGKGDIGRVGLHTEVFAI